MTHPTHRYRSGPPAIGAVRPIGSLFARERGRDRRLLAFGFLAGVLLATVALTRGAP
jgi:hypothetical protein